MKTTLHTSLGSSIVSIFLAAALLPISLRSQSSRATGADEETIVMSRFEVSSKTDRSYNLTTATAGLKTRQELIDIPGSIQIVPRNLIEDLGNFPYPSDFAKYISSGLSSFGGNNLFYMRGERLTRTFKNGVEYFPSIDDDVTTETMEVVKGAQAVLFGTRPVTQGMLLRTTKVPLYSRRGSVRALVDSNGMLRGELDLTGPVDHDVGGARAAYRFVGAQQDGKFYQDGIFDDRTVLSPSFQLDWKDTTVRLRYEYSKIETSGLFPNNFLDQDNQLSYIAGRKQGYKAPWSLSTFTKHEVEGTVTHRITSNFESKLQVAFFSERRYDHDSRSNNNNNTLLGANGIVDSSDYIQFNLLTLHQMQKMFSVVNDYISIFDIAGHQQQTNFGWAASSVADQQGLVFTPLISPETGTTRFNIINPVFPANPADAIIPGTANTIQRRSAANIYVQHQAHLIQDHLIATAGGSWSWSSNTSHLDVVNAAHKESKGDKGVYKVGLVYKPRADLSFFASQATNFAPAGADDRDPNGIPLPPTLGKVQELGVKTMALNGRVTASMVWFRNDAKNLPVRFNLGQPNVYALAAGSVRTEGVEYDLNLRPVDGWTVIATLFDGRGTHDQTGATLVRTYRKTWSLLTKYDFADGPLKGFGIGANLFHMGATYQRPLPAFPDYDVYNVFATYTHKEWNFNLGINNVFDEDYAAGGNSRFVVYPSTPRTFSLTAKYNF
ncbi:MAG: hypothetical protein KAX37_01135 [Opitutaceae bacterium]|nr:hypothetical protein [Opitutaceae bacterium]